MTSPEQQELLAERRLELLRKARLALSHALGEVKMSPQHPLVRVFVNRANPKDLQAEGTLAELRQELGEVAS